MGKLSKVLLKSLFFLSADAQTSPFSVPSCNVDDNRPSPPALTFRIAQAYFENFLADQTNDFEFADGFYSRTIPQNELQLGFDGNTDDLTLSYTLQTDASTHMQVNASTGISFAEESIQFQCRYPRTVNADTTVTAPPIPPQPVLGVGALQYTMNAQVGHHGGDTIVNISANHDIDGVVPTITKCRIHMGEHEVYAAHDFNGDVCFDNARLNMVQTLFGKDIAFSVRTFRFSGNQTSGDQEQTISCELHLEPTADVPQQQASDCTCYDVETCAGSHCAMIFDGINQTGASEILDIGEHECCDLPTMPLNDKSESVYVTPGCSLTLYQHLLSGTDDAGLGTGIFHTFTHGSSDNNNLALLGLANEVSSYQCSCPPTCAMVFDGPNHTGASAALPEGDHGCCDTVMPLNDAIESVNVTPGCSLTLYEHLLPGVDDNGPLGGTGIFHTFTSGNSENENLADLGLANEVSSYTCTCPPTCAILFDGKNQTGAYIHLTEGEMMCCTPPIMPLNDISESVYVTPGCTLTLYEHHRDAGIVHTFTNDGSPNNDDFALLGLANNVSSYECSCQ